MSLKTGMLQRIVITRQFWGTMPTFCIKCGKQETTKIIREDASYSKLCECGCTLYQFHLADEFHKTDFFTKKFIPKKLYRPDFKGKSELEKIGFEKTQEKNGKIILTK